MKTLKKLFFEIKMTWLKVVIFAVVSGAAAGLLLIPTALRTTSFVNPGTTFEYWMFAAILIVLNCEKPLEAACKTFTFFLISQPLVYLVQVPFNKMGFGLFQYYPPWALLTVFTFPAAIVAWYLKKKNLLSVVILAAAQLVLGYCLFFFCPTVISFFPHMLLTVLFIIAQLVIYPLVCFEGKERIISLVLAGIIVVGCFGFAVYDRAQYFGTKTVLINVDDGEYTFSDDKGVFDVSYDDDGYIIIKYDKDAIGSEGRKIIGFTVDGVEKDLLLSWHDDVMDVEIVEMIPESGN